MEIQIYLGIKLVRSKSLLWIRWFLLIIKLVNFLLSVTIQTPETSPVTAPRHVSGGGGKVGTLSITWDVSSNTLFPGPIKLPPQNENKVIVNFFVNRNMTQIELFGPVPLFISYLAY